MSLISSGIDGVRAFGLAVGIGGEGDSVNEPLSVLVEWRSEHEDKLHQVYVNGEFAGVSRDGVQRSMVVAIRSSWSSAVRVEVFAVEFSEGDVDLSYELKSAAAQMGRVEIGWLRLMGLPLGGSGEIFSNGGSGEIDHGTAVTTEALPLWCAWQDKVGFGLSRFGQSDLGFDGAAAIGFGRGMFGEGEFGFDSDEVRWLSEELETGDYKFAIRVTDMFGVSSEDESESDVVALIRHGRPAAGLQLESYDKSENRLVLSVS